MNRQQMGISSVYWISMHVIKWQVMEEMGSRPQQSSTPTVISPQTQCLRYRFPSRFPPNSPSHASARTPTWTLQQVGVSPLQPAADFTAVIGKALIRVIQLLNHNTNCSIGPERANDSNSKLTYLQCALAHSTGAFTRRF